MSTDKKRDLAKDLVDFLLKEGKKSDDPPLQEHTKKTEDARTEVLENTSPFEQSHPIQNETKSVMSPVSIVKPTMTSERGKAIYGEVSKLVGGAEAIKVAQARIQELEKERDELRTQIDELLVTCESLQRQMSETKSQLESLDKKQKQKIEIVEEEKIVMRSRLSARENELARLKKINEEIESRFQNDLKKIRVREKEYENKNVILKAESSAVARAKDEMILDLKRKIDQFQFEIDNYKTKFSQTDAVMNEMTERQVRTVKALRLALSILETDDFEETTQVKAAGNE